MNSQSGSVHSEYTIYVTEYDALQTLDINEVAGEFTKDANGVPTTITVTLPESMARDELGYALDNVKLPMNFTVYGDRRWKSDNASPMATRHSSRAARRSTWATWLRRITS